MIDRIALLAITPLTLAGGAVGWSWSDSNTDPAVIEHPQVAPVPLPGTPIIPRLSRSSDGLFRAMVDLDGHLVPMVIDTGATRSVLSARLAKAINLRTESQHGGYLATVNGTSPYRTARVSNVRIGSLSLRSVDMIVAPGPGVISLVGQDILRQLGPMRINGNHITFE